MHLVWENTIPNLILHWTGTFKKLDDGCEDYEFPSSVWDAIGLAMAAAGSTIPSTFICQAHLLSMEIPSKLIDAHWEFPVGQNIIAQSKIM